MVSAACLLVGGQPVGGEIRAAQSLEIHRQEGDVGGHVPVGQAFIEVEAVEHARTVVHHEHVVGEEVAVTVADPPRVLTVGQERSSAPQVALGQSEGGVDVASREDRPVERHHLGGVLDPERPERPVPLRQR